MSDIELQGLHDQKKREFKLMGAALDRFELDFVDAVNRAAKRINIGADLATRISPIGSPSATLTGLDDTYEYVLSELVTDALIGMGQRREGKDKNTRLSQSEVEELIDSVRQDILHDRQDDDEDDDTYDNVGLGKLG